MVEIIFFCLKNHMIVTRSTRRQHAASNMSQEPDIISLDHFPLKRGVMLNTKLYNAATLARHLKTGRQNVPHSRRKLTPNEYHNIMHKAGKRLGPMQMQRATRSQAAVHKTTYDRYMTQSAEKKLNYYESLNNVHLPHKQAHQLGALLGKLRKVLDTKLTRAEKILKQRTTNMNYYEKQLVMQAPGSIASVTRAIKNLEKMDLFDLVDKISLLAKE